MPENTSETQQLIQHLDRLNTQLEKQTSFWRMLFIGIVYGIGYFIGFAILATILFGILGPIFGHIKWVRDAFTNGASMAYPQQR